MSMTSARFTSLERAPSGLDDDLLTALDSVQFARSIGIQPDGWQAQVLRSRADRLSLNASRQSGKSTCVAILALHEAIYRPNAMILLLSPSLRQSSELFRTVAGLLARTGATVPTDSLTKLQMTLKNASRILSLPASEATIRGFGGVSSLIIDEASRVPDELYEAVVPMLATTQGRIAALSTPFGRRGWWAEAHLNGGDRWRRWDVPAEQCPRIAPDWLAEQRESMGRFWYAQEFGCEFVENESAAFTTEDVSSMIDPEAEVWRI